MFRKLGFALMFTMLVLAALLQRQSLLYTRREPPKITSQIEYKKPDGTIVHATAVEAHPARVSWFLVVPIGAVFVIGAALASFTKSK